MRTHRYGVGQTVRFVARSSDNALSGGYEIIRLLPEEAGEPRYRLKSVRESHERVAAESQLERMR